MIRRTIHSLLRFMGYKISRISNPIPEPFPVLNPIHHNTVERMNEYYQNEVALQAYLTTDRISFMNQICDIALEGWDLVRVRIADVGCGTGDLLNIVSQRSGSQHLVGYDFSISAIDIAAQKVPDAKFYVHDIYTPLPDTYDVIICTEVLEHLEYPDRAVRIMLDSLSSNGKLVLTVPNGRIDNYLGHIHFWSPESWLLFLQHIAAANRIETHQLANNRFNAGIISGS